MFRSACGQSSHWSSWVRTPIGSLSSTQPVSSIGVPLSIAAANLNLGRLGLWRGGPLLTPEIAAAAESLGYGTVWLGGSPSADLAHVEELLDATSTVKVATGIVNIWTAPAAEVAASFHRLENAHPGRFILGVGIGHREAQGDVYQRPYSALVEYLDVLDAEG